MEEIFKYDIDEVMRVAGSTAISFMVLFGFIRITGKRTLASLSAFDFVVVIALGSTLAEMMLLQIPMINGVVALVIILAFQFGLAWLARRSKKIEDVINANPTLLYIDGSFIKKNMDREMVTESEVYSEIRSSGIYDLDDIKAIVLELNGHVTVVKKSENATPKRNSLRFIDEEASN
ncbi:MAG: DUF421 domain-containing protein [Sphingobacteriales bacterium]|nr:MAG: DUF421 domain-containing protein [Sphingobacteriales bacterium]